MSVENIVNRVKALGTMDAKPSSQPYDGYTESPSIRTQAFSLSFFGVVRYVSV